MDNKVTRKFKGTINGVEFYDEQTYNTVVFIVEQIEKKFGEIYNNKFIEDFRDTINSISLKFENYEVYAFEREVFKSIENSKEFKDIRLSYYGNKWKLESINDNIKNEKYNKNK